MAKARRPQPSMPRNEPDERRDDPPSPEPGEAARYPRVRFIGETYRLLFEKNPLPMWVYDVKSLYFLAVNDAAVERYGYSRNEFLRMTIKDIRPPSEVPRLTREIESLDSSTESIGIWRHIKRDGTLIDVEVRGNEIDFDGHRARLILALDITERARAERRLRTEYAVTRVLEGSASFREAVPRILRAVCEEADWEYGELWRCLPDGDVLRWEGAWHVEGFPSREFENAGQAIAVRRGVGIPGTTWATGRPEWLDELTPARHFQRTRAAEALGLRQGLSFPITGHSGRVLGIMVFFSRASHEPDPTFPDLMADLGVRMGQFLEAEHADDVRRQLAERFSKAFYLNPLPAIISRLDGSRLIDVNESFVRAFGYRREELIGKTAAEVNILQPIENRAAILEPLSRGEGVRGIETVLRTKGGELRQGRLWSERVDLASEPTILTIIEDVTDYRRAEARLIESERLASIGRTAAFVAHELNTPLTNIALLTANLRGQITDPALRDRLDRLDAQRRVAGKIIEGVLSFTRSTDLKKETTDLGVLLRIAAEQAAAFRREGVSLALDLGDASVSASVDPLKMSQVFVNLIKNAFQATEQGTVTVSLRPEAATAVVRVRDTGKGMSPEERDQIFKPFFTTKARGEGVGLGLTFTKTVVDAHGGQIELETEPGKGAVFTLRLPLGSPAA